MSAINIMLYYNMFTVKHNQESVQRPTRLAINTSMKELFVILVLIFAIAVTISIILGHMYGTLII